DVDLFSVAGGRGVVGVGASVAVLSDASTNQAKIGDSATVNDASSLSVTAGTIQVIEGTTKEAAVGVAAVGASFIVVDVGGDGVNDRSTRAQIGSSAHIGNTATVGTVNVSATHKADVTSDSHGLAGGVVAGGVNFTIVTVDPKVTASVGSSTDVHA